MLNPADILASSVEYYLPVFLPIMLSILSVISGMLTGRIKIAFSSLLKVHSDLVLGLFSFIIWAFVAQQQTGRISLNAEYEISSIRVVFLLFADFLLLMLGLMLLRHAWKEEELKKERWWNGAFLILTIGVVLAPLGLKTQSHPVNASVAKAAEYSVAIPYTDGSIAAYLGPGRWGDRLLCEVRNVKAEDRKQAIEAALKQFDGSVRMRPLFEPRKSSGQNVVINRDQIVAEVR
jgi:hypothetical protein